MHVDSIIRAPRFVGERKSYAKPSERLSALQVTRWFLGVTFVAAAIFQLVREPDITLAYALLACCAGMALLIFQLQKFLLLRNPLPSIVLIGFGLSYFYLPVIGMALEGKSVITGLDHPVAILGFALAAFVALIVSSWLAATSAPALWLRDTLTRAFVMPTGLLLKPSSAQIWLIGGVGLAATTIFVIVAGHSGSASGAGVKILNGLFPFVYAPYFLVAPRLFGSSAPVTRNTLLQLALYSIPVLLIGMARNSRSAILLGFASAVIAFTLALWLGIIRLDRRQFIKLAAIGGLAIALLGPVADLATAMVIVRGQRSEVSSSRLLWETWEQFQNKKSLEDWRGHENTSADWQEKYLNNLFLNRLCNLRYGDIALDSAFRFNDTQRHQLRSIELERLGSFLPTPAIRALGLNINKEWANSGSMGDFIYHIDSGKPSAIGGFRTGNMLASAYICFGPIWPLLLLAITLPSFILLNTLSRQITRKSGKISAVISLAALMTLFRITFWLTSAATGAESFSELAGFALRGFWQNSLIYLVLFWITRWTLNSLGIHKARICPEL